MIDPEELRDRLHAAVGPVEPGAEAFDWLRANVARRRRVAFGTYVGVAATALAVVAVAAAVALPRREAAPPVGSPSPTAAPSAEPAAPDPTAAPAPPGATLTLAQVTAALHDACAGHDQNAMPQVTWSALGPPDKRNVAAQGPAALLLRRLSGPSVAGLRLSAAVTDPAGQATVASGTVDPDRMELTLAYPRDFPGAPAVRDGAYRVDWQTSDGRSLACSAMYLTSLRPRARVAGPAPLGDVDGDGLRDVVEIVDNGKPRSTPSWQWGVRADMTSLGVQTVWQPNRCCGEDRQRVLGVVDMDADGTGEVVLQPLLGGPVPESHDFVALDGGMLRIYTFVLSFNGEGRAARHGWGCADDKPANPGRQIVATAVQPAPEGFLGTREWFTIRSNGNQESLGRTTETWAAGAPVPAAYTPEFSCGGLVHP